MRLLKRIEIHEVIRTNGLQDTISFNPAYLIDMPKFEIGTQWPVDPLGRKEHTILSLTHVLYLVTVRIECRLKVICSLAALVTAYILSLAVSNANNIEASGCH